MPTSGILLFAHGARDPRWADPFHRLRDKIALLCPEQEVMLAFLEQMSPSLPAAVADLAHRGIQQLTLVPLFMAQGAHLRQDLPPMLAALQQQHPHITINVTSALGDAPEMLDAIARWVRLSHQEVVA